MADSAFQTMYRQEFIAGFEQHQSLLRDTVTTQVQIKGNSATFLVVDSGGAEAVTRGINGLIPARPDNLVQTPVTLVEWHDLVKKTSFNIFSSQGDQRAIMQQTSMAVINRKIDKDILDTLATATVSTGAAVTGSLALVMKAKAILGLGHVPWDSNLFGTITPAFEAYLMQTKEFASREYVNRLPMEGADAAWRDKALMYHWLGVSWMVHPDLPGAGTADESNFLYHKSAVGHAVNSGGIDSRVGYDEEQDYSWARTSIFMGSELLQNSGVVVMHHDGSAFAAA